MSLTPRFTDFFHWFWEINRLFCQPPPQARRFSHGRGERETSDWWWTARDHGKGTAHIFIKRETCGYEAAVLQSKCGSKRMIWRHTPNQEITGKLTSLSNDVGMCRAGHTINATPAHRRSLELISFCCDILRRPTFWTLHFASAAGKQSQFPFRPIYLELFALVKENVFPSIHWSFQNPL